MQRLLLVGGCGDEAGRGRGKGGGKRRADGGVEISADGVGVIGNLLLKPDLYANATVYVLCMS